MNSITPDGAGAAASAWPTTEQTCAICVLYAIDERYSGDGDYIAKLTLYEGVPVSAVGIAFVRLNAMHALNLVKHFSVWSTAGDATLLLRIPTAQPRETYDGLRQHLK